MIRKENIHAGQNRTAQHNERTLRIPRCTAQQRQHDFRPKNEFRVDKEGVCAAWGAWGVVA